MDPAAIDAFLQAEKNLVGTPSWEPILRSDQFRLVWPIALEGEIRGPHLLLRYAAAAPRLVLSIGVNVPPMVQRLDINAARGHNNGLKPPSGVPAGRIKGNNYHPWDLNRGLAGARRLPRVLRFAVPYHGPENPEAAFSWFCELSKIERQGAVLPQLPPRGTLL